jgi:putative signal transducing protein
MWVCTRCGERNDDGSKACSNCAGRSSPEGLLCPDCRTEYRPGFDVCADCGVALVERGRIAAHASGRLVKIWSATHHTEAELLRVALRRAGIESILENEGGADYAVGLGTSLVPYVITVSDRDAQKALDVIRAEREPARPDPNGHPDRYFPPVAMILFSCACGQALEVPPDFDGLEMDCPYCNRPLKAGH